MVIAVEVVVVVVVVIVAELLFLLLQVLVSLVVVSVAVVVVVVVVLVSFSFYSPPRRSRLCDRTCGQGFPWSHSDAHCATPPESDITYPTANGQRACDED